MDLYSVDPTTFQIQTIIDEFNSLIWTERYNDAGEVTLEVPSTAKNKAFFTEGMFLWVSGSREIANVKSVLDEDKKLTITGPFLVDILKDRILRNSIGTAESTWPITATPGDIAATIVREMCTPTGLITSVLPPGIGTYEVIDNLTIAATPTGTVITMAIDYGNVFDGVKQACDQDGLGFTLYQSDLSVGSQALTFLVYAGRDLTSSNVSTPTVIFDPALDSLTGQTELRSIEGYKTAAYAWPSNQTDPSEVGVAYANGTPTVKNFARRSMIVDASDVDASKHTVTDTINMLNKRAKNALVNNNYVRMVDGTVVPQASYKYGTDYLLGDIVELRGASNIASSARVVEYIRTQDGTGATEYPTLSVL